MARSLPLPPPSGRCTCGHDDDLHDRVARRYCAATLAGDLSRGCICRVTETPFR